MGFATAPIRSRVSDLEIEEWICERYGFVPHPFWIGDCRELYLNDYSHPCDARHRCPPDKRPMIRAAFVHFGVLQEEAVSGVQEREQLEKRLRAELDQAEHFLNDATPEQKLDAVERFRQALRNFSEYVLEGKTPKGLATSLNG